MLFLFLQSQSAIIRVYITSENYGILISQMECRYFNVVTMNSHTWVYYIYDVTDSLPFNPRDYQSVSVTSCKLTTTIRNNILNYKKTLDSIELDEGQLLNDYIYPGNVKIQNSVT